MTETKPIDHTSREEIYYGSVTRTPDLTKSQERSIRNYFETGDIDKYLGDKKYIAPEYAMFLAPIESLDDFLERTINVWEFVFEHREKDYVYAKFVHEDLDRAFLHSFHSNIHSLLGCMLTDDVFTKVFKYFFGDNFMTTRCLPLSMNGHWNPKFELHLVSIFGDLAPKLRGVVYDNFTTPFFSQKKYVGLADFFNGMIKQLPASCFIDGELDQNELDGARYYDVKRIRNFVACVNLMLSDDHLDYELDEVPIVYPEIHKKFVEAFEQAPYKEDYDKLVVYLKEQETKMLKEEGLL